MELIVHVIVDLTKASLKAMTLAVWLNRIQGLLDPDYLPLFGSDVCTALTVIGLVSDFASMDWLAVNKDILVFILVAIPNQFTCVLALIITISWMVVDILVVSGAIFPELGYQIKAGIVVLGIILIIIIIYVLI